MGEIADMMLDGTMCCQCGVWLHEGDDGDGYPMMCESCAAEDAEPVKPKKKRKKNVKVRTENRQSR